MDLQVQKAIGTTQSPNQPLLIAKSLMQDASNASVSAARSVWPYLHSPGPMITALRLINGVICDGSDDDSSSIIAFHFHYPLLEPAFVGSLTETQLAHL